MGDTSIGWTDVTWNPIRGCSRVSPGCENCYAETHAARFSGKDKAGKDLPFAGYAERTAAGPRWTRKVSLLPHKLAEPLSWREPRCCFVNSMSDLFHEKLTFEEIAAVFGVIAACPGSIFQALTKRAGRAREFLEWAEGGLLNPVTRCAGEAAEILRQAGLVPHARLREMSSESIVNPRAPWPLPNLWLGVSAEDQKRWDERVPELLRCPAAVRFVSAEPLLGPIDMGGDIFGNRARPEFQPALHQVIVGAESGPGARPMETVWAASIRDQCKAAGTACYIKQFATSGGRKKTDPTKWPGVKIPAYLNKAGREKRLAVAHEVWPQEFPP